MARCRLKSYFCLGASCFCFLPFRNLTAELVWDEMYFVQKTIACFPDIFLVSMHRPNRAAKEVMVFF